MLLLDFGDGLVAVAYGTAAGAPNRQFASGIYYGTRGTIDGVLLERRAVRVRRVARRRSARLPATRTRRTGCCRT